MELSSSEIQLLSDVIFILSQLFYIIFMLSQLLFISVVYLCNKTCSLFGDICEEIILLGILSLGKKCRPFQNLVHMGIYTAIPTKAVTQVWNIRVSDVPLLIKSRAGITLTLILEPAWD